MLRNLSCRDTFSGILKCPLKTSFKYIIRHSLDSLEIFRGRQGKCTWRVHLGVYCGHNGLFAHLGLETLLYREKGMIKSDSTSGCV